MMKRLLTALLALVLLLGIFPLSAFALDLPAGWWPVWSAYNDSLTAGNEALILEKGDAVVSLYSSVPLNPDTANGLYMVYSTRMKMKIYEKKMDWAKAIDNTEKLLAVSEYLNNNGNDQRDMITVCKSHLKAVTPFAEVYAVSAVQKNAYTSKTASKINGAAYGVPYDVNAKNADPIASYYVGLDKESARKYAGIIGNSDDGKHILLINYNFDNEGDTARSVPKGTYDKNITDTMQYLATLNSSVLIRIGGEMNVWTKTVAAADYIKAYDHVAALARKHCPKAELVWAPNFVSAWNVDINDYYPNDSYVDWVGVSLYYNYTVSNNEDVWLEYAHAGQFADPLICAAELAAVAEAHKKPMIVTESGTLRNADNGGRKEAWAAEKVAKQYSTLNMVYPQFKAIVQFNSVRNGNDYTLSGKVKEAYDAAIKSNPTLNGASSGTWVKLGTFNEKADSILIGATGHTYQSSDMKTTYAIDGKAALTTAGSPNHCRLTPSKLSVGAHRLDVTFDDGKGWTTVKTYTLTYSADKTVKITEGWNG